MCEFRSIISTLTRIPSSWRGPSYSRSSKNEGRGLTPRCSGLATLAAELVSLGRPIRPALAAKEWYEYCYPRRPRRTGCASRPLRSLRGRVLSCSQNRSYPDGSDRAEGLVLEHGNTSLSGSPETAWSAGQGIQG